MKSIWISIIHLRLEREASKWIQRISFWLYGGILGLRSTWSDSLVWRNWKVVKRSLTIEIYRIKAFIPICRLRLGSETTIPTRRFSFIFRELGDWFSSFRDGMLWKFSWKNQTSCKKFECKTGEGEKEGSSENWFRAFESSWSLCEKVNDLQAVWISRAVMVDFLFALHKKEASFAILSKMSWVERKWKSEEWSSVSERGKVKRSAFSMSYKNDLPTTKESIITIVLEEEPMSGWTCFKTL